MDDVFGLARITNEFLDRRSGGRRGTDVVDHVQNASLPAAKGYGDHVVESHARCDGRLEGEICDDARISIEEAIAPESPRLVTRDRRGHLIRRKTPGRSTHPLALIGDVVRHLFFKEERATA